MRKFDMFITAVCVLFPIIVYSVVNYRPHLGQICNFRDPNFVTFYFYELTHFLNGMKNTLFFTYSTNILVRLLTVNMKNCLTLKNPKMCDPNYRQSNRENATPSSGTSPLASYKEVPPGAPTRVFSGGT